MKIKDYVEIKKIPELVSIPKPPEQLFGKITKEKGSAIFLHNGREMRFIAVLEFKKGFGARGNHHHKKKHEYMYILSGKGKAQYWLPENPKENMVHIVDAGNFIYVKPGCAHAYTALENMRVVEFSPQPFDPTDDYDVENLDDVLTR